MFVGVRVGGYNRELGSFFEFGYVSSKHSLRPLNLLARHCSFFPGHIQLPTVHATETTVAKG